MKNIRPVLIKNGHIIDPSLHLNMIGSLMVADSKIIWIGETDKIPAYSGYDVINAQECIVCPGFIDLHCHLRQPGYEDKETIATGTRAGAKGGFTTVCCMPNTKPPLEIKIIIYVNSVATKEG